MAVDIQSKVLVYENDAEQMNELKGFFKENNLIGLRADSSQSLMDVLACNLDLGAIFMGEDVDGMGRTVFELARDIHYTRSELPIFLRCKDQEAVEKAESLDSHAIAGAYVGGDREKLSHLISSYIFNRFYPSPVIRSIQDGTKEVLSENFEGMEVNCGNPYLIRDRLIYGQLFSLIRLESDWCRGYMMLQADETSIAQMISAGRTSRTGFSDGELNFRSINMLVSEMTNAIWGKLKASFFNSTSVGDSTRHRSEIPSVINHTRNYITFGTEDPKLCFRYILQDGNGQLDNFSIYQKFVFHLRWAPETIEEKDESETVDSLVETGGLVFL